MSEKETGKTLGTEKPVSEWEKEDVLIWVRDTLKNNEITEAFRQNPISGKVLFLMKPEHFEKMRIDLNNQILLEEAISNLKQGNPTSKFIIL
jgi:hypothetical protein